MRGSITQGKACEQEVGMDRGTSHVHGPLFFLLG